MKYAQYMFTFLMGYFLYAFVEVVSRGYTHWTMCLTGGAALTMLYFISRSPAMTLIRCCIIGAAAITAIVWDYSDQPLNVLGQICPLFTVLWGILCIPAFFLCQMIRRRLDQ